MKSAIQIRAEAAAKEFRARSRSPIVIEFAGVPKAGKTSTLNQVQAFLRRCGFTVGVVVERASVCPIKDKKHANFNIWTACTTLAQVLEQTQTPPRADDPDILFLDRGVFDAIWWLALMERLVRIRKQDREIVENFLLLDDWRKRITGVIVMTADPADSLQREKGRLPVDGAHGSIMNPEVLEQTKALVANTVERLKDSFRLFVVNTSLPSYQNAEDKVCNAVAEKILSWVEDETQENILSISKDEVAAIFHGRKFVDVADAQCLAGVFITKGAYAPRSGVEEDYSRVQALPVVIVRNRSGEVLRLKRKEKNSDDILHEKIVIWAGGHVRKEDAEGGNALLRCAERELQEELRLNIESNKLRLIGGVYVDSPKSSSKHAAIVYEWRADTDDVAVALSSSEFFERRGTSLSGRFVNPEVLARDADSGKLSEAWSEQIVKHFLAPNYGYQPRLIE